MAKKIEDDILNKINKQFEKKLEKKNPNTHH